VTLRQLKCIIKRSLLGLPLENKIDFDEKLEPFHAFTEAFDACIGDLDTTKGQVRRDFG